MGDARVSKFVGSVEHHPLVAHMVQKINYVSQRIDPVDLAALDQGMVDRVGAARALRANEQRILPSQSNGFRALLGTIVAGLQESGFPLSAQRLPVHKRAECGVAEALFRRVKSACGPGDRRKDSPRENVPGSVRTAHRSSAARMSYMTFHSNSEF